MGRHADIVVVGGGLSGSLVALAFARWRPELVVELYESGERFGGNHVWSVFDSDLGADARALVEPAVAARWPAYDIAFPARRRAIDTGYASLTSDLLDGAVRAALGGRAHSGVAVTGIAPAHIDLPDGTQRVASCVLDARGLSVDAATGVLDCGWQTFVGQTLRLKSGHGLTRPIIMDATVRQHDGYRFVYLLPFGPDRLMVEDTYYRDDPVVDGETLRRRIADYVRSRGWVIDAVEGEEAGCLPVVCGGSFDALWPADDPVARIGMASGLFHPVTGYSLPVAAALAVDLARQWPVGNVAAWLRARAAGHWAAGGFYRTLNRMLFRAAEPLQRYRVLEHFHRLPQPLIERFYAGRSTLFDKARILSGKPPVPVGAAFRAIRSPTR